MLSIVLTFFLFYKFCENDYSAAPSELTKLPLNIPLCIFGMDFSVFQLMSGGYVKSHSSLEYLFVAMKLFLLPILYYRRLKKTNLFELILRYFIINLKTQ